MKTVIEHGRREKIVRRFICTTCGCIFKADEEDYKRVFDRNESYCYTTCPECGKAAYSPDQN